MTDSRSELMVLAERLRTAADAFEAQAQWHDNAEDSDCEPHDSLSKELSDGSMAAIEAAEILTRLAASQPDREMVARCLARAEWPLAMSAEQDRYAEKHWRGYLQKADAILLLLVGDVQKKLNSDCQHQTEQSGKQLSQAIVDAATALYIGADARYHGKTDDGSVTALDNLLHLAHEIAETDAVAPGDAGGGGV